MKERRLWLMLGIALDVPLVSPNWSRIDSLVDALRALLGYRITLKALCGDDTALYRACVRRDETMHADTFVHLWRVLEGQGMIVPYSDLLLPVAHSQRLYHKKIFYAGKKVMLAPMRSSLRPAPAP